MQEGVGCIQCSYQQRREGAVDDRCELHAVGRPTRRHFPDPSDPARRRLQPDA